VNGPITLITSHFIYFLCSLPDSKGLRKKVPLAAYVEFLSARTVEWCRDSFRCFQPMPLVSRS